MLLWVFGIALFIVVVRLGQLQVVNADYYRAQARQAVLRKPKALPFVRGSILDRTGEPLVRDEPGWALTIDFAVIAAGVNSSGPEMTRLVERFHRTGRYVEATTIEETARAFRAELSTMWTDLASFASLDKPVSADELRDRGQAIHARIKRIRRIVTDRRGFDAPVAEERQPHGLVTGLDATRQIEAREWFRKYPWVHVRPSTIRRVLGFGEAIAHVVGRMGRVDATNVAADPNADDPFARYRANERLGVSGVEYAAEARLRGRRGRLTTDRDGQVVSEATIEAENGEDVFVTLNAELQRRLYRLLGETVDSIPNSSGGSLVVLDVATREVLALVSYPSYDPNRFDELYPVLRDDTERMALRFRAVSNRYPPGSTVKPLTCLTGLMSGLITPNTLETCTGYLLPDHHDRWRCWKMHGTNIRKAHGSIDVVGALTGSCNVFMYRLGDRVGVDRLCNSMDMVGFGHTTGLGLREEVKGVNPTPSWLATNKGTPVYPGHARNFAIGQGEILVTPVQLANLMAIYASGTFRTLTLISPNTPIETPELTLPVSPEAFLSIRRGIYGVVNDPNGTAYNHAHFLNDRWALCGKTGSATAHRWPTAYRVEYTAKDGSEQAVIVQAGAKKPAIDRFVAAHPDATFDPEHVTVSAKWPRNAPKDSKYSHAWFGGYLQEIDAGGRPNWTATPPLAFSVMVEFGGSGSRTTGPLAKRIAQTLLDVFGPELTVDRVAASGGPS